MDRLPADPSETPVPLDSIDLRLSLRPIGCTHHEELIFAGEHAVAVVYDGPRGHISVSRLADGGDIVPAINDLVGIVLERIINGPPKPPGGSATLSIDPE